MTEPEEHPPGPGPEPGAGWGAEPGGSPSGPPRMSEDRARAWATGCHVAGLAWILWIPFANIVAPLIIWLLKRDDHPLIEHHGKESLNFQISMTIYAVVSGLLTLIVIGFVLLGVIVILNLVFPILAAIKTSNGEDYRYPITIRMVR